MDSITRIWDILSQTDLSQWKEILTELLSVVVALCNILQWSAHSIDSLGSYRFGRPDSALSHPIHSLCLYVFVFVRFILSVFVFSCIVCAFLSYYSVSMMR